MLSLALFAQVENARRQGFDVGYNMGVCAAVGAFERLAVKHGDERHGEHLPALGTRDSGAVEVNGLSS